MKIKLMIVMIVLLVGMITHHPVMASGVVTTCDEISLVTALTGGGVVDFNIGMDCEIVFTSQKIISVNTTIQNTSGDNIVFTGDYYTPIDTRLFTVNSGVSLTLDNLMLRNGKALFGGAIYVNQGTLTINNSTFFSNVSTDTTVDNPSGGAIYGIQSTITINNSYFESNSSQIEGGAIENEGGDLQVTYSSFQNNTALNPSSITTGGAISSHGRTGVGDGSVIISDSVFINNTADYSGGVYAFYHANGVKTIVNNHFINNHADHAGALTVASGSSVNFIVSHNIFVNNQVTGGGGAIWFHSGTIGTVDNNMFYNNSANTGGALNIGFAARVTARHNTFVGNTAPNGGSVYIFYDYLIAIANIFQDGSCDVSTGSGGVFTDGGNNIAYNATGCVGANVDPQLNPMFSYAFVPSTTSPAANAYASPCAVSDDQFGTARPLGGLCDIGAVEGSANPNTTITTCSESVLNLALAGGGVVDFNIGTDCTIPFTFEKIIGTSTTVQNTSVFDVIFDGGGNVGLFTVNNGATLTLDNLTLQNAYSLQGGAVFNDESTLNVIDSVFDNNHTYTTWALFNIYFDGIRDGGAGGAILSRGESVTTITGSTFIHNRALYGGAVSTQSVSQSQLTINDSIFSDNWALTGGAILASHIVTITDSIFDSNLSDWEGIVVYTMGMGMTGGQITILDSAFINHIGEYLYGVLVIVGGTDSSIEFSIQRNHFINNTSTTGSCSAIRFDNFSSSGSSQLVGDVTNNTFSGNISTAGGGTVCSIANDNSIIDIVHNTFVDNNMPNGNNLHLSNVGTYTATGNIFQDGGCIFELGASLIDGGNNIAHNATGCVGTNVNPQLGVLVGGAYHIPANNAIEYVPACEVATDQLGMSRPFGALCTPGAIEIEDVAPVERDLTLTENGLLMILSAQAIPNTTFVVADITPTNITIVMGYAGEYSQVVIHVNDADFTQFTIESIGAIGGESVTDTYSDFVNQYLLDVMLSAVDEWMIAQVAPATAEIKQITISDVITITVDVSN